MGERKSEKITLQVASCDRVLVDFDLDHRALTLDDNLTSCIYFFLCSDQVVLHLVGLSYSNPLTVLSGGLM